MQLTLPSGKTNGWLILDQGDLAGKRYHLEISICQNPVCQCGVVSLQCSPVAATPEPDRRSAPVSLEMDLTGRRIGNLDELKSNSDSLALADAVFSEITESDWNDLHNLYVAAKRHHTEHADLDQIDVTFPADVIADGSMVGYYEILPFASPVEVPLDGQSWLFDDQYCVIPKCSCRQSAISFQRLPAAGEATIGAPGKSVLSLRYDYHNGRIEMLPESAHEETTVRKLLAALHQVQPDVNGFLAKRHDALRRLYRCALTRKSVRLPTPKPGRNEPCPCGSGKKYKKCCGA